MSTTNYRAYRLVRQLVKECGGTMRYERGGTRYGAWKISLNGRTKTLPAEGNQRFPELDCLYEPDPDKPNPKTWNDYKSELVPNAKEQLLALVKAPSVWIFQAIPKQYDLKKELRRRKIDRWLVTHFRNEIKKGDSVIFWQAGRESGIYGIGYLKSDPYWKSQTSEWRVRTEYTSRFDPPLLKTDLLKHPVLKTLRILKAPFQGTNFRVSVEQWNALGRYDETVYADEVEGPMRYREGTLVARMVNAYERNPEARRKCLEHYGYRCEVCRTNFEQLYGELGRACIHVHHLNMLSEIGRKYHVDPIKDLRPVCPNCHSMLHWKGELMSIKELRTILQKSSRRFEAR